MQIGSSDRILFVLTIYMKLKMCAYHIIHMLFNSDKMK